VISLQWPQCVCDAAHLETAEKMLQQQPLQYLCCPTDDLIMSHQKRMAVAAGTLLDYVTETSVVHSGASILQ